MDLLFHRHRPVGKENKEIRECVGGYQTGFQRTAQLWSHPCENQASRLTFFLIQRVITSFVSHFNIAFFSLTLLSHFNPGDTDQSRNLTEPLHKYLNSASDSSD